MSKKNKLILFISLFGLFHIILKDQEISSTERRKLNTFPEIELTSEYIEKIDKYLLDHFPLRDTFRSVKALYNYKVLNQLDNNNIYLKNNYIFKSEYPTNKDSISFFINKTNNIDINKNKFNGLYNEFNYKGEKIILLKPQMYINLSGEVIKKYVDFYKIDIDDLLIISDDLDMDIGKIKIKYKGSSGGHNGLKNIESNLKTKEYKRIKIGISNNKKIDTKNYVLSKFSLEENKIIDNIISIFPQIFEDYMNLSFDNLMNKYN